MKRCLACQCKFPASVAKCPACGFLPVLEDGVRLYAPQFSKSGGGFKSSYFSELASLEAQNFWFRSRNRLIFWALRKYCKDFQSFLEVGCGTGYVLSGVSHEFPDATLLGSEIFTAGLGFAAARLPSVSFIQMDARNIPYSEEFDVIGAFDVLEHIDEDEDVLRQFYAALKPHGLILLTVPQHAWLWSSVDEYACHIRRYSARDIHHRIEASGFQIIRSSSFVTTLLPAMLLSRLLQRGRPAEEIDVTAELKLPTWLNSIFLGLLNFETFLIKWGLNFPVGGSRLVIAKK